VGGQFGVEGAGTIQRGEDEQLGRLRQGLVRPRAIQDGIDQIVHHNPSLSARRPLRRLAPPITFSHDQSSQCDAGVLFEVSPVAG
jgi:hypothetical protein